MQVVTSTLAKASRTPHAQPYIAIKFADHGIEAPHFDWTELYAGSESDEWNDTVIASDGSINTVRIQSNGNVMHRRVTNVGTASQWSTWSRVASLGATHIQPAIVAGPEAADEVRIFFIDLLDDRTIKWVRSTDQGATWGSASTAISANTIGAVTVTGLAGDGYKTGGMDNRIFWSARSGSSTTKTAFIWVSTWSGSSWSQPSRDPEFRYNVNSIAVHNISPSRASVYICDGEPARRVSLRDHDTSTGWGGGAVIIRAGEGSNYDYHNPTVTSVPPSGSGRRRYFIGWTQQFTGTPARTEFWTTYTGTRWIATELVEWQHNSRRGSKIVADSNHWYIVSPARAHRSTIFDGDGDETLSDSTEKNLIAIASKVAIHQAGQLRLTLLNDKDQYTNPGTGRLQSVKPSSQVQLTLGYKTSIGVEALTQSPWFVERIDHHTTAGLPTVVIDCIDPWTYLERFPVRRPITHEEQTAAFLCRQIWTRVCGADNSFIHARMSRVVNDYVLRPGQDYARALIDLNDQYGLITFWRGNPSVDVGPDSVRPRQIATFLTQPVFDYAPATDRTDSQHPIHDSRLTSGERAYQSTEVYGTGFIAIRRPYSATSKFWRDNTRKITDISLESQDDVDRAGDYSQALAERTEHGGWIESQINPAIELGDSIAVTQPSAGLDAATRMVNSLDLTFSEGELKQRIGLS